MIAEQAPTLFYIVWVQSMTSGWSWSPKWWNNTYHWANRLLATRGTGANYIVLLVSSMCIQRTVLLVFPVCLRSWLPDCPSLTCLCGRGIHVRCINNTSRKQLKVGAEKFKWIISRCRSEFADHSSGFCVILVPITRLLQGKVVERGMFL